MRKREAGGTLGGLYHVISRSKTVTHDTLWSVVFGISRENVCLRGKKEHFNNYRLLRKGFKGREAELGAVCCSAELMNRTSVINSQRFLEDLKAGIVFLARKAMFSTKTQTKNLQSPDVLCFSPLNVLQ